MVFCLRFGKQTQGTSEEKVSSVVSYLTEIYQSVAETLPDFRDDTWDVQTSLELGDGLDKDDYADLLLDQQGDGPGPSGNPKGREARLER